MSWAAHELEAYVIGRHARKLEIAFSGLLLGSLAPDLFTKLPVYGLNIGSHTYLKAADAAQWHRGWPGAGFTNSLLFGVVIALVALAVTRHRAWALGLLIGDWAHALTDSFDSVGSMLLFPFTTQHYSVGMWRYSAQAGRYSDAAAYYSGLGGLWDLVWILVGLGTFEVLRRRWFDAEVRPVDPFWDWAQRHLHLAPTTVVAMYRAWFLYGAGRAVAWTLWARLLNPRRGVETVDLTWGGPRWIPSAARPSSGGTVEFLARTAVGVTGVALALTLAWLLLGRRLWRRADHGRECAAAAPAPAPAEPDPTPASVG